MSRARRTFSLDRKRAPSLAERLTATPYDSYVYAYPHKTAYGPLEPAPRLSDVWHDEDKSALFLYVHVPFCEMRCATNHAAMSLTTCSSTCPARSHSPGLGAPVPLTNK